MFINLGVGLGSIYGLGFGGGIDYGFILDFLLGLGGSGMLELILVIILLDVIVNLFGNMFGFVGKENLRSFNNSVVLSDEGLLFKY